MSQPMTVVIVSPPGITHNVLHNILQSFSRATIQSVSGALSAYDLLQKQSADCVVIDGNVPLDEQLALLTRIKQTFPALRCVVFTVTSRNHAALRAAGADYILQQNDSLETMETVVFSTT